MAQAASLQLEQRIAIHSPATLQPVGEVAVDSPAEVRLAVARACAAYAIWRKLDFKQRGGVLLDARDALLARREELIELIVNENGKPRTEALTEIAYVCDVLTFYAKRAPKCLAPHVVKLVLQKHVAIIKQTQGESTTVCERANLVSAVDNAVARGKANA